MEVYYDEDIEKQRFIQQLNERNKQIKNTRSHAYSLDFEISFGINNVPIANQLLILGDGLVIFSSGTTIVVKDLAAKTNLFLCKEGKLKNVTALAAVTKKNGGLLVAAGESTLYEEKPAVVNVISTKKNKWFCLAPNAKGIVKHICLHADKKYCAFFLLQNNNSLHIYFWNYRKEKLLTSAVVKATVEKFSLHPAKPKNIIFAGNSYFKMWENHFQERTIKESPISLVSLKIEKENKFLDQTWILSTSAVPPTLLVLASGNKIFILQNEDLKKVVEVDTINMNIIEVNVQETPLEETDDAYGINNLLEDLIKEKPQNQMKDQLTQIQSEKTEKQINKNSTNSNIDFCCITSTKKGFIVGGTKGCLSFYDLEKNFSILHSLSFQMKIPNQDDNKITFLSSSAQDSLISIVSLQGNSTINYSLLNTYHLDSEMSPIQPFFPTGFHTKRINSISCSSCKSIFATCSEDNTVKIWNYYDSETTEKKGIISQAFKEEPLCLSLHPSGLYIAICFSNCFKVFGVLNDSFFSIKEVNLTNCKIIKYAHGGSFLLTNEKSNILIFDSIYYETLYILDGHTALIKDACISEDDFFVVSTCMSGYVYCWNLLEELNPPAGLKSHEHQENTIYNCVQYDNYAYNGKNAGDYFIGSTNDKYLCIYKSRCKDLIAEFPTTDCYVTAMLISRKLGIIFLGTNRGSIRISSMPLNDETLEWELYNNSSNQVRYKVPDFYEIQAHSTPVTTLCLSHDLNYIFSGGEDGTLFVFKIKSSITNHELMEQKKIPIGNLQKTDEKIKDTQNLNDLFLAKILKIMDKNELIKQLSFEVVKFEQKLKIETQRIEINYRKNLEQIESEFQSNLENDRQLKHAFEKKSNDDISGLQNLEEKERIDFESQIEVLKVDHAAKVEYEKQRNKDLELTIDKLKQGQQEELVAMLDQHKQDLIKLRSLYQEKCEKIQVKYSNVVDNAKNFGNAFIQRLDKEDQENELELDDQIKELQEKKNKAKVDNSNLQIKHNQLLRKNEDFKLRDSDMQKELEKLIGDFNKIRIDNVKNDEDIIKMNHQLVERLQVIESKEETCKSARDEQINLENFRYMLDQKIKMLQNEKTQILAKIAEKEKNLKNMFNELIKEANQNENKYQEFKRQNVELNILEESVKKSDLNIFLNSNILNSYRSGLLTIIKHPDKMAPMADKLNTMLEKSKDDAQLNSVTAKRHISNEDINEIIRITNEKGDDINDEIFKQGKWMAKKHFLIKKTCDQLEDIRDRNMVCVLNQNTKLIEECNDLRAENDRYKKMTKNAEKLLAEAIRKKQKLIKKKREQSPNQLKKISKKYEENSQKLNTQNRKLVEIKDSMNEILNKHAEDESTRLPPIGKNSISNSSFDVSKNMVKKVKEGKEPKKSEIIVEEK